MVYSFTPNDLFIQSFWDQTFNVDSSIPNFLSVEAKKSGRGEGGVV
jgi:hypothetical protein